jgi:signal transduction histidine kinase
MNLKNTHRCKGYLGLFISFFLVIFSNVVRCSVFDLSNQEFDQAREYKLEGKWEFYWNEFLEPKGDGIHSEPILVNIPSTWNKYKDKTLPILGFGTYKATIILPHNFPDDLAIVTNRVKTAHAIYINGKFVGGDGTPGQTSSTSFNSQNLTIHRLKNIPASGRLEIIIHVSNFIYPRGGFDEVPVIGFAPFLENKNNKQIILTAFMAGAFLLIGLYHFALWIRRKAELTSLVFALLCTTGAVRMFFSGSKLIIFYLPKIPAETMLKIDYLTAFLLVPIMHTYVALLFPGKYSKPVYLTADVAFLFITAITLFCSVYVVGIIVPYYEVYIIFVFLHIFVIGLQAIRQRKESAILFTIVFGVVILSGISDIFVDRGWIRSYFSFHLAILLFILAQAVVLSRRFTNVFIDLEQLNRTLESQVFERTNELSKSKETSDKLHRETKLLSLSLNNILESERKSIAMVLHDSMGASLIGVRTRISSIKLKISSLIATPDEIIQQFDSAIEEMNVIYNKNRNLVRNLRPELIDVLGLKTAIESLVNEYNKNNIFYVDLKVTGDIDKLPEIFRICQEAVTNIIKYAKASEVIISLAANDELLKLKIIDNGNGFNVSDVIGIGLIGMREKVDNLKGKFTISSTIGTGTAIEIELPISSSINE